MRDKKLSEGDGIVVGDPTNNGARTRIRFLLSKPLQVALL